MQMNAKCQEAIAHFLNISMQSEQFDRETIREAIHQSSPAVPRLSFINLMNNLNTPKGKLSPPTPIGAIVDQKMREIHTLKAQLDSEKYERGYLEVQCKQYEEQISKLTNDKKHFQLEIERLKNDLETQDTENFSPNRTVKEEAIKSRLKKEVEEKMELIYELKGELENIKHEKQALLGKLAYTEKETRKQLVRVQELEMTLADNQEEMQQRQDRINDLEFQVKDLEFHLQQVRNSNPKEVLDSSGDLLDFSMNQSVVNVFSGKFLLGKFEIKRKSCVTNWIGWEKLNPW